MSRLRGADTSFVSKVPPKTRRLQLRCSSFSSNTYVERTRPISIDDIQLYFVEQRGQREMQRSVAGGQSYGADVPTGDAALPQLHTRRPDLRGRTPRQRDYIEAILGMTSRSASAQPGPARPTSR